MRILLLGAYGFIGSEIARALLGAGHEVVGLGRSTALGRRLLPQIEWVEGDLDRLTHVESWIGQVAGFEAIINASGALQNGADTRLSNSQAKAIVALIEACESAGVSRFIQVSAPGASQDASTEFMRTKAVADERLKRSGLEWTILRPGLVIGRNAYGGTLLIRSLAAFPAILPIVHGDQLIQTVAMKDVVEGVLRALAGWGGEFALVEDEPHRLRDILVQHRQWLGLDPPAAVVNLPAVLARPVGMLADALGWLGWRSPLRSTALEVIAHDVRGDAAQTRALLGRPAISLEQTLAGTGSGIQDRWHARLTLLLPFMIASLALLWLASGLIGLLCPRAALAEFADTGLSSRIARAFAVFGSVADLAVGGAILARRTAKAAALGMIALTVVYLAAATALRPDLWLDPLAPLIKTVPAMLLALAVHAMLDER